MKLGAFYEQFGLVQFGGDEGNKGPASIMLTDPDGNPILIDQHR